LTQSTCFTSSSTARARQAAAIQAVTSPTESDAEPVTGELLADRRAEGYDDSFDFAIPQSIADAAEALGSSSHVQRPDDRQIVSLAEKMIE
jgi:hypothetical protein